MLKRLIKSHLTGGTRTAFRNLCIEVQLQRRHFRAVKQARHLSRGAGLKLNLGSGSTLKLGWLNIDLFEPDALQLDLREDFPFPSESVSTIYSEHFLEHLEYPEAVRFLQESWRVLVPGGGISLVVPDTPYQLRAYLQPDEAYISKRRAVLSARQFQDGAPLMHILNYDLRQERNHKYSYDLETLADTLTNAGFVKIERRSYDPQLDSDTHRMESLYVDARKPID